MADVEDPDGSCTVEAEPTECCRCMLMWVMVFFFVAFMAVFLSMDHFHEDFPVSSQIMGYLALVAACWPPVVFSMLVVDWYNGNPEGERVVDSLIQSKRGVFLESFHQYLQRIGVGN
jgi:hypothetical protein